LAGALGNKLVRLISPGHQTYKTPPPPLLIFNTRTSCKPVQLMYFVAERERERERERESERESARVRERERE